MMHLPLHSAFGPPVTDPMDVGRVVKIPPDRTELTPYQASSRNPRVLIFADIVSARFGGEAVLPLHYFRQLRARGVEAWLITHVRTREELIGCLDNDLQRVHFVPDTRLHRLIFWLGRPLRGTVHFFTVQLLLRSVTQLYARRIARRLIAEYQIDVVHQPAPVSPKDPTFMYGLGVPVVIGPLNGGMSYPPAFRRHQSWLNSAFVGIGRTVSKLLHRLIPGKRRAATILVANRRTQIAIPKGVTGRVATLVENGVDLTVFRPRPHHHPKPANSPVHFTFAGRLIGWKCVDLLIKAFKTVESQVPARLEILGDGPMRPYLEAQVRSLGLTDRVFFRGWLSQPDCAKALQDSDVLVLPSVYECGGAVVLEAMAVGLPVIATNWGGPADYLDNSCGILVDPVSSEGFIDKLASAMLHLARNPDLRASMGAAGRRRIEQEYDWRYKTSQMLEFYDDAIVRSRGVDLEFPAKQTEPLLAQQQ